MLKYILKRILMVIPVLLGVTIIIFFITRILASDPAPVVLGEHATAEAMAAAGVRPVLAGRDRGRLEALAGRLGGRIEVDSLVGRDGGG